jgi:hypothetical protein
MRNTLTKLFSMVLIYMTALPMGLFAQEYTGPTKVKARGNAVREFFYSKEDGEVLIPVSIWGDAGPERGRYHIPKNTTLEELVTVGGGVEKFSYLKPVLIKRVSQEEEEVLEVDFRKHVKQIGAPPIILKPNDLIVMENVREDPWYSTNFLATLSLISALAAVVAVPFVIAD